MLSMSSLNLFKEFEVISHSALFDFASLFHCKIQFIECAEIPTLILRFHQIDIGYNLLTIVPTAVCCIPRHVHYHKPLKPIGEMMGNNQQSVN